MTDCLHCDINELVQKRLEDKDADLSEIANNVSESLADLILSAEPADQLTLLAEVVANLGSAVLEKTTPDGASRH